MFLALVKIQQIVVRAFFFFCIIIITLVLISVPLVLITDLAFLISSLPGGIVFLNSF